MFYRVKPLQHDVDWRIIKPAFELFLKVEVGFRVVPRNPILDAKGFLHVADLVADVLVIAQRDELHEHAAP